MNNWFKKLFAKKDKPKELGIKQLNSFFIDSDNHKIHICVTLYSGKHYTGAKRIELIYHDYALNKTIEKIHLID